MINYFENSDINKKSLPPFTVCVVGLDYVGTSLAEAFAEHLPTIGFDIDRRKTDLLTARLEDTGHD